MKASCNYKTYLSLLKIVLRFKLQKKVFFLSGQAPSKWPGHQKKNFFCGFPKQNLRTRGWVSQHIRFKDIILLNNLIKKKLAVGSPVRLDIPQAMSDLSSSPWRYTCRWLTLITPSPPTSGKSAVYGPVSIIDILSVQDPLRAGQEVP